MSHSPSASPDSPASGWLSELVRYDLRETGDGPDVAVLTIVNPPLNVLSHGVPEGVLAGVARSDADRRVGAVVLIGAGRSFVAGADIRSFRLPREEAPDVRGLVAGVAASAKPVVAALHGSALGGGLELALACDYRVAAPGARLGTPEVRLGLLPGAGGTQRLPRLVGLEAAFRMVTTGESVLAEDALGMGLVDALVEGEVLAGALEFARALLARGGARRPTHALPVQGDASALEQARRSLPPGLRAPQAAARAVAAAASLPFEDGMKLERELFLELLAGEQSRSLRHLFFAERAAAKLPELDGVAARDVKRVGVVGAGTMGSGVAIALADAGIPVTLLEADPEGLERGLGVIAAHYRRQAERGRVGEAEAAARLGRVTGTLDPYDLKEADFLIEAVFEDVALKREVFGRLGQLARPGAVLATNTSALDLAAITAAAGRPQDVLATHFFSPVPAMRLVEVAATEATAPDALKTALALARRLGKLPVLVGACEGFVGNRMFRLYLREAMALLAEGATPQRVDAALEGFGMAMGPFRVSDLAGLDIGQRIRRAQPRPEEAQLWEIADALLALGRSGQKSGAGFYRYDPGSRTPQPDPEVEGLVRSRAEASGTLRRDLADEEIVGRLLFQLVNEGARLLAEGMARRAGDIDLIFVNGYGFPAHRGGPMFYADEVGLSALVGGRGDVKPAPLLLELAEAGLGFRDYDAQGPSGQGGAP